MVWHSCCRDDLGHFPSAAIPLHHGVKDVPAVEAAPAHHPQTVGALQEVNEVILRHTTLTTCAGHTALLLCLFKTEEYPGARELVRPKRSNTKEGGERLPALFTPVRRPPSPIYFWRRAGARARSGLKFEGPATWNLGPQTLAPHSASLRERAPVAPQVRTIEVRTYQNNFPLACYMVGEPWTVDGGSSVEFMVNTQGGACTQARMMYGTRCCRGNRWPIGSEPQKEADGTRDLELVPLDTN